MTDPKKPVDELPEALIVVLRAPVEYAGQTYTELSLREPTADEWSKFSSKDGVEADIAGVSIVSGVPEMAIRKIGARDLRVASKYLAGFLS